MHVPDVGVARRAANVHALAETDIFTGVNEPQDASTCDTRRDVAMQFKGKAVRWCARLGAQCARC